MTLLQNLKAVIRLEEFKRDPVERRLAHAASVADLRRIAKRRLPGGVFDYVDGGSDDERTLARNTDAFAQAVFRPRVLRNVSSVDISSTLLGQSIPYPLVLRPDGVHAHRASRRGAGGRSCGGAPRTALHALHA